MVSAPALAKGPADEAMTNFSLTEAQLDSLGEIIVEFAQKQDAVLVKIEGKQMELVQEIRKEDRFDSKFKERRSARKVNKITKQLSKLHGELLKNKVAYLLKAKNVLTTEQKMQLIAGLDFFDDDDEDNLPDFLDIDVLIVPLDLTKDQIKKIMSHETNTMIKELKIELDLEYQLLDLQEELGNEAVDPAKVDATIMKIADLGTKILDNRVNGFLKSKDVLTIPQKKMLLHMLMI